jgi:hypothetical protein
VAFSYFYPRKWRCDLENDGPYKRPLDSSAGTVKVTMGAVNAFSFGTPVGSIPTLPTTASVVKW